MPKSLAENVYEYRFGRAEFHGDPSRPGPYPHGDKRGGKKGKGRDDHKSPKHTKREEIKRWHKWAVDNQGKAADRANRSERAIGGKRASADASWGALARDVYDKVKKANPDRDHDWISDVATRITDMVLG